MQVYVVTACGELMTVCGDRQTAEWERDLFKMEGYKNIKIAECGVVNYNEDFRDKQMRDNRVRVYDI